jgi:hypothetical protein
MLKDEKGGPLQSAFLGTAAPKAAPEVDFIKLLTHDEEKTSVQSSPS